MLEKNIREKVQKKPFCYIHTNIVTQKGEKSAKQVFQKHTNSAIKKCGKKHRREKGRINVFYIHTNIVTQKRGGETSETSLPETHE